jgi:hypothetical protein
VIVLRSERGCQWARRRKVSTTVMVILSWRWW